MKKTLNPKLSALIAILNDGRYHDGDSIGAKLSMTRSAVWKSIRRLQEYGVKINSVKGRGYAMLQPLVLLDSDKIQEAMGETDIHFVVLESIDSTNTYLKKLNFKVSTVCIAELQTAGRGRFDRNWHSPFAENLYLSYGFYFTKDISELAGLSLVSSLAVVKALNTEIGSKKVKVKWPNDILYQGVKLSGSLIEINAESHGSSRVIIGIGVNVNMIDYNQQINQNWTSLRKITGEYHDRNKLAALILQFLQRYIERFLRFGFKEFISEWADNDCLINETVIIKNAAKQTVGTVLGVNEQGYLLLQTASGASQAFSAGDTTILKR